MKIFFLLFLFIPSLLFSQNFDRSLYREVPMMPYDQYPLDETQYFKSLGHFRRIFHNNSSYRLEAHFDVAQGSHFFDFNTQNNNYTRLRLFQVIMIYYRIERVWDSAFRPILDHVELIDDYLIIGAQYIAMENLRLRNTGSLQGEILLIIQRDRWVRVLEKGNEETINGIKSVWVRVQLEDGTEGWCFGGYLGFSWLRDS